MKQRVQPRTLFISLSLLCLLAVWLSLALGPVSLPLLDTLRAGLRLLGLPIAADGLQQAEMILGQIRLPRTLLGLAVGAVLALSGVAMQGLFRNPLADPGLVGVAAGAAMGAAVAIVGGAWFGGMPDAFAPYLLSFCAFVGGLGVTALVYRLGRRDGQTNVATMLLAGVAMTALGGRGRGAVFLPGRRRHPAHTDLLEPGQPQWRQLRTLVAIVAGGGRCGDVVATAGQGA